MNVFSGPPSAAPGRYSLFYLMMTAPYAAYGVDRLITIFAQREYQDIHCRHKNVLSGVIFITVTLSIGLFLYSIGWGIIRIPSFPNGMPRDAVETGYVLSKLLDDAVAVDNTYNYMVELRYWEFLAVQLTAGHYEHAIFDRDYDIFNRNTPSIFSGDQKDVHTLLASSHVHYVALKDQELKDAASAMDTLQPRKDIGGWSIYEVSGVYGP
jgi:hypothetical protein